MENIPLKKIIPVLIPVILTLLITFFLQRTIINNPEFLQNWLKSFGVFTIFIYIIVQALTIIIAPLGGTAAAIAILAIFGPFWGIVIIYFVTAPLFILNFLIARKYGRGFVRRLIGSEGMRLVDKYTGKMTIDVLILMKLFLTGYSDFVAYAAGFTKTSIRTFIIVTYLGAIPWSVLQYLIFKLAPNFTIAVTLMLVIPGGLGLLYLPFHKQTKKFLKRKNIVSEVL